MTFKYIEYNLVNFTDMGNSNKPIIINYIS